MSGKTFALVVAVILFVGAAALALNKNDNTSPASEEVARDDARVSVENSSEEKVSSNEKAEIAEKSSTGNERFGQGLVATVYKSPNCPCCVNYEKLLSERGFEVKVVAQKDTSAIKEKYGLSADKQSCHTTVIGDYFVEGHTPLEAVKKLLAEKPAIDGIGLPGMPAGAPGMGGNKQAPFQVYAAKDGKFSLFLSI